MKYGKEGKSRINSSFIVLFIRREEFFYGDIQLEIFGNRCERDKTLHEILTRWIRILMKIHKQLYQNIIFYLFLRNVTNEKSLYLRIKNDVTEKNSDVQNKTKSDVT